MPDASPTIYLTGHSVATRFIRSQSLPAGREAAQREPRVPDSLSNASDSPRPEDLGTARQRPPTLTTGSNGIRIGVAQTGSRTKQDRRLLPTG